MAKTVESLRNGGLEHTLYHRVKDGDRKTISEWAEELDTFPMQIQGALGRLRKMGVHIHPVGTRNQFGGPRVKGVLVDIMTKPQYFEEVYERRMKNTVIPAVKDFTKKSTKGALIFPQFRNKIRIAMDTVVGFLKGEEEQPQSVLPQLPKTPVQPIQPVARRRLFGRN